MGFFTISNKGLQAKTYNRNINSLSRGNIIDMSCMISYATFLTTIPNANVLETQSKAHRQQAALRAYHLALKTIVKTVTKNSTAKTKKLQITREITCIFKLILDKRSKRG